MKRYAPLIGLLALANCASIDMGSLPPMPAGDGRLIVERNFALPGLPSAVGVNVDKDDDALSLMVNESGYIDVPQGGHMVHAHTWLGHADLFISLEAGETRRLETGYNVTGWVALGRSGAPTGRLGLAEIPAKAKD